MVCPQCSHTNSEAAVQCVKCATPLPLSDQTLATGFDGWSVPAEGVVVSPAALGQLSPGTVLGNRYEIVRLLGQGGMGAVYQASDRELERHVALKVIRSDMAANPEILRRFKQELLLARQITHKNVIRIFDLGQSEGIRFLTMEYIEGEDLQTILRRKKKLEPAEAANFISQVCRALEAAHAEGVIHRDLKPQNIMLDKSGRACVMDFGIARSMLTSGMTQTGALIGTPDYMSPEQAKGLPLDARSDLFSVGIIFYELLSGEAPFHADTTMGKLWKRTHEPARPLRELDKTIPPALSDIVRKCLEIDPQKRFASAAELLQQIELWQGPSAGTRVVIQQHVGLPAYAKWAGAGLAVALLAVGFFLRSRVGTHTAAPHAPVSVLIADFTNDTADSIFDGTLEPMLGVALEGASFISLYNRGQARKVAVQLQPSTTHLDESLARLVASREGVGVIVAGSITHGGDHYSISCKTVDAMTGRTIATSQAESDNKDAVLRAVDKLAARVRTALGDATPESTQLAQSETFTTASLEAAHEYGLGQDALWAGKYEDAIQHYGKSLKSDPDLGRAYSGLAVASIILGRNQEGMNYYKSALSKIDRMSEREKYRTRGTYYVVTRDTDKAIEELSRLVQYYPADTSGYANLALAYFYRRDMARALKEGRQAVAISPKNVLQRNNVGLYAMYAGDFDTAIQEQRAVLELNPSLAKAFLGIALSQAAEGKIASAYQTYHELEKQGSGNASTASAGLADLALYESRPLEAIPVLEKGISEDLANKDRDNAAIKLTMLAYAYLLSGKTRDALAAADKALTNSKDDGVVFFSARMYLGAGRESNVIALAKQLEARTERDSQAYGRLIEGEIQLRHGKPLEAIRLFKESQKIADAWLVRFDLGRGYIEAGQFPQADSEFELCLNRRGEATAAFLDEVPTIRLLPDVYYYLGRAQEGLGSPAAAQSYKTFLAMKAKDARDPLVLDARRRVGSL